MVLISMSDGPIFFFLCNYGPDIHEQLDDFRVVDSVECSHICSFLSLSMKLGRV